MTTRVRCHDCGKELKKADEERMWIFVMSKSGWVEPVLRTRCVDGYGCNKRVVRGDRQ